MKWLNRLLRACRIIRVPKYKPRVGDRIRIVNVPPSTRSQCNGQVGTILRIDNTLKEKLLYGIWLDEARNDLTDMYICSNSSFLKYIACWEEEFEILVDINDLES